MNYTIYFSICSFFYSAMIIYVIFKSKIPNTNNNKAYKALAIINLITIIFDIIYNYIAVSTKSITTPLLVMSKLFPISLLGWITCFTLYLYSTLYNEENKSFEQLEKVKKKAIIMSIVMFSLASIGVLVLPIHHNLKEIYSYGPGIDFVNYYSEACLIFGLFYLFKNYKNTKSNKYSPFFVFIAGGMMMSVLQSYDPKLLFIVAVETFVTFMIYFTLDKSDEEARLSHKEINKNGSKKMQK